MRLCVGVFLCAQSELVCLSLLVSVCMCSCVFVCVCVSMFVKLFEHISICLGLAVVPHQTGIRTLD